MVNLETVRYKLSKSEKFEIIKNLFLRAPRAFLYAKINNFPGRKLGNIGITGSKGKTSVSILTHHILSGKFKTALISTIEAKIGEKAIDTGFHVTTPDSSTLQNLLKKCVDENVKKAVLEATSHGLFQKRFGFVNFEGAVFTNIAPDHMDYHPTFEKYFQAKASLFRNQNLKFSVLNMDSEKFEELRKIAKGEILTYSMQNESADFFGKIVEQKPNGSEFELIYRGRERVKFFVPVLGRFYVLNSLAAIAVAKFYGMEFDEIAVRLKSFPGVSGRMEDIEEKQNFTVLVDFAHTPDSLEALLKSVRPTVKKGSKIITVFGNAGERDAKRREMGAISAQFSDITILTAEDPRSEPVEKIMDEAFEHGKKFGAKFGENFFKISDRREAIQKAFEMASKNDVVLLCGKGHEKSMNYGKGEEHWSDQEVAREELKKLNQNNDENRHKAN